MSLAKFRALGAGMHRPDQALVEKIGEALRSLAGDHRRAFRDQTEKWRDARWSQEVKDRLCQLGKDLGFTVRASGCRSASPDGGEWLYDVVWREERDGLLVDIPLVVESEWLADREIDVDFVKLVQARAGLRLMVFQGSPAANRRKHLQLLDQIRAFKGSRPGDSYLFAMFHWAPVGEFEFAPFVVQP